MRTIRNFGVVAALLLAAVCGGAQVIGVQPTPQDYYYWNSSTNAWVACPNSYASFPLASTAQPIAAYGLNTGLNQWTPVTGLAACPSGSSSFSAGGDLAGSNSLQEVVGLLSIPFCTGFSVANGQAVILTTSKSPNPCWTSGSAGASYPGVTSPGTGGLAGNPGTGQTWEIFPSGSAQFGPAPSGNTLSFTSTGIPTSWSININTPATFLASLGGTAGLTYPSPTLGAIPYVTNVTAPGTVSNSPLSVSGGNVADSGAFSATSMTDSALVNSTNAVTITSFIPGSGYTGAGSVVLSGFTCSILPTVSVALAGSPPTPLAIASFSQGTCTVLGTANITGSTGGTGASITLGFSPVGVNAATNGTLGYSGQTTGWGGGVLANDSYIWSPYITSPVIEEFGSTGAMTPPNNRPFGISEDCGGGSYAPMVTVTLANPLGMVLNGACMGGIAINPTSTLYPPAYFGDPYQFLDFLSGQNTAFNALIPNLAYTPGQASIPLPQGTDWYETLNAQEAFQGTSTTFGGAGNGSGYTGTGTCTLAGGTLLSGSADTCTVTASGGGLLFTLTRNGLYAIPNALSYSWGGAGSGAFQPFVDIVGTAAITGSTWMDALGTYHITNATVPASITSAADTLSVTKAGATSTASYSGHGTATITGGSALSNFSSLGCVSGHVCDSFTGDFQFTGGDVGLSTATLVTINLPITRTNKPNCLVTIRPATTGSTTTAANSFSVNESTSAIVITEYSSALDFQVSTTWDLHYNCGGN